LRATFKPLFQLLDTLLAASVPTGYRLLPLVKTSPIQYLANLRDLDLARLRELYLGVSAQASEVDILTAVQRKAKMGPATRIETLVSHALPGLALMPESQPPQGIPAKAGFKYFRVHQTGELWDGVQQGKSLALHLPGDLPSPKLELVATLES
jgi:type VI secretion system protein ImpJ